MSSCQVSYGLSTRCLFQERNSVEAYRSILTYVWIFNAHVIAYKSKPLPWEEWSQAGNGKVMFFYCFIYLKYNEQRCSEN